MRSSPDLSTGRSDLHAADKAGLQLPGCDPRPISRPGAARSLDAVELGRRNVAILARSLDRAQRVRDGGHRTQLGAFLDAIEGQRLYPLYHLAAFAGMRRGELCGISWDDVDLDAGKITVRWQIGGRTYRAAKAAEKRGERGEYRTKPKTRAGEDRVVDLDQLSVKVLRTWRKKQAAERLEWGPAYINPVDDDGNPYNLVFTREDGSPLDPGQTYLTFVRLVKDAGLAHLKLHGLRHINISLQLDAGVSETIIAMRVGHTSPALIRSTYGHLIGTVG